MKKKIWGLLLALVMMVTLVPAKVEAVGYSDWVSVKFNPNAKNGNELTITVVADEEEVVTHKYGKVPKRKSTVTITCVNKYYEIDKIEGINCNYDFDNNTIENVEQGAELKVYLLSKHTVTINYEYMDKSEENSEITTKPTETATVLHGKEFTSANLNQSLYTYKVEPSETDTSGNIIKEIINEDKTYTVIYTPKNENSIVFGDYYLNGILSEENIVQFDGYKLSDENATEKTYIMDDEELVGAATDYQYYKDGQKTYELDNVRVTNNDGCNDIYYKASEQAWYYNYNDSEEFRVNVNGGKLKFYYKEHNHSYTSSTVTNPTCTEKGYTTYTCDCGDSYTDDEVAALGHDWNTPTYTWSDDYSECTATVTCKRDSAHEETGEAVISKITENPTCEEKGSITYTATFTKNPFTTQTKKVDIKETGHDYDYDNVKYTWSDDYSECTATVICKNDKEDVITETVEASVNETAPTCTEAGKIAYTVAFENEKFADQTATVDGKPATGHSWDNGVVTKEATKTEKGEKTFTCTACEATRIEEIPMLTGSTDDNKDNNNQSNNQNGKDNTKKEVKSDIPKTGDNSNVMTWLITMMGAALVAAFSLKRRVK